jgi:hypothetical protein
MLQAMLAILQAGLKLVGNTLTVNSIPHRIDIYIFTFHGKF